MALEYDGANSYITVSTGELVAQNEITVVMWINPVTIARWQILYAQNDSGGGAYVTHNFYFSGVDGKLQYDNYLPSGGSLSGNTALTTGVWEHVGFTRNSGTAVTFYKGGNPDGSGAGDSRDSAAEVDNTLVGARYYSGAAQSVFEGLMADVRVYNRLLSATEIKILYEARGSDNIVDGLVGRWLMNEKPDGIAATGANSVIDISVQGNHGTPTNNPVYRASPIRFRKPIMIG